MKILGIDPGSTRAGYGVIDFNAKNNTAEYLDGGIISVSSKEENQRLLELKKSTEEVIRKHKPEVAGIEKIYFNKNVKTAIEVAQARGVLIVSIQDRQIPIYEFTPSEIKQGLTGYGSADKKSIEIMAKRILKIEDLKQPDDVYDALAIALVVGYSLKNNMNQ